MSVVILPKKDPEWLWLTVEHISKKIPDEDRNLIKKGWDQLEEDVLDENEKKESANTPLDQPAGNLDSHLLDPVVFLTQMGNFIIWSNSF
jgi:hypothetical protein